MNLWLGIVVGLKEIAAHKFRSALTMLGIILGVCSLVGMFALVAGMSRGMELALREIGGLERVSVVEQEPPKEQEDTADLSPGCTINDVQAIAANCPLVDLISPEVEIRNIKAVNGAHVARPREVVGARQAYLEVNNHQVEEGRFITDLDLENFHRVCILGTRVRDDLFPGARQVPLGQTIDLNGQTFTVVGLLRYYESEGARKRREAGAVTARKQERRSTRSGGGGHHGGNWFDWKNDTIIIPLTTMQAVFRSGSISNSPDPKLTSIDLRIGDVNHLSAGIQQVKNVLLATHHGIEDFGFNTQENWSDRIQEQSTNAIRTGGLIASISLIVGGIGIMNIMLASISERIREIGIRKAIGARQRDIFLQIIVESTTLALLGGLIGLVVAFGLVKVLEMIAPFEFTPVVRPNSLIIAFLFSAGVGVLAGLYPAFKASRYDPIEALRYE